MPGADVFRVKTDTYDLPQVARAKRREDRASGIDRAPFRPLAGTKRSGSAIPFRGDPINRSTTEPLFNRRR